MLAYFVRRSMIRSTPAPAQGCGPGRVSHPLRPSALPAKWSLRHRGQRHRECRGAIPRLIRLILHLLSFLPKQVLDAPLGHLRSQNHRDARVAIKELQ